MLVTCYHSVPPMTECLLNDWYCLQKFFGDMPSARLEARPTMIQILRIPDGFFVGLHKVAVRLWLPRYCEYCWSMHVKC